MTPRPGLPGRLRSLAELLRLSLAPSVIADLCGGVALGRGSGFGSEAIDPTAGLATVGRMAAVSLLLFCGGMALNAWVDREEDRRTRPKRPLPSGAIRPGVALVLAVTALVAAPLAAFLLGGACDRDVATLAAAIAAAIALYHTPLKRSATAGPLLLGAIRGGDLLLGAVAVAGLDRGFALAWPAAAAYAAYVVGASCVAHEEDRAPRMTIVRAGVVIALAAIAVNGGIAWAGPGRRLDSRGEWIVPIVMLWHLLSVRPILSLFRVGAPGLTPLASFARVLLARMPLLPMAAAFGAGAPDLGVIALGALIAVFLLVRVIPPT